jgi:hypothetical protein
MHKSAHKCARIYMLAIALVMIAYNLVIFPNVQLVRKYARIYALVYASGIQALRKIIIYKGRGGIVPYVQSSINCGLGCFKNKTK